MDTSLAQPAHSHKAVECVRREHPRSSGAEKDWPSVPVGGEDARASIHLQTGV